MAEAMIENEEVRGRRPIWHLFGWMLIIPLLSAIVLAGIGYWQVQNYMAAHEDRIYTGVSVMDIDLSQMTQQEAASALGQVAGRFDVTDVSLVDPRSGSITNVAWSELGVALDVDAMVDQAFVFGRNQTDPSQDIFRAWYSGQPLPAVWIIDEAQIENVLGDLEVAINQPLQDGSYTFESGEIAATSTQTGFTLDRPKLRTELLALAQKPTAAVVELSIEEAVPQTVAVSVAAEELSLLLSGPISFFVEQPVDSADLNPLTLSVAEIEAWITVEDVDGMPQVSLDTGAAREWLLSHALNYDRFGERARFYFDDLTQELVLIKPHINGRTLDTSLTMERLLAQINTPNRSVALAMNEIVPDVHSGSTAAELGITELLSAETTYFYDSAPERKHNIRLGASKFHGIVVAPAEEFSFNEYVGSISAAAGFQEGLVIIGGRTQGGIGGGICQVSTTIFQTVFWSGLAIGARNQHGYRVPYYEMAPKGEEKPLGMDAAIYTPIVDFTFTNNTPHHLLIEAYYREDAQSLEFKFYSTSLGRTVERDINVWNEQQPGRDKWIFNPDLESGEIKQVEWSAGGADVMVHRVVLNQWGDQRDEDFFQSEYSPWSNVFEYGPDVRVPTFEEPTAVPEPDAYPEPEPTQPVEQPASSDT